MSENTIPAGTLCHHHEECNDEAVYSLTTANGSIVYVCESCDEDYSLCEVCIKCEIRENMCGYSISTIY